MKSMFMDEGTRSRQLPAISSAALRLTGVLWLLVMALSFGLTGQANAAPFASGNIVVERLGDGSTALSSAAAPVFLDEYTPAGTLVQSIAMPTAVAGSNKRLTDSGSATSNGYLSRSTDGRYLVLPGYDANVGTASVAGAAGITRVVGRVDSNGAVDTTTSFTNGYTGNNFRSAASTDGTDIWLGGTATSDGGVRYIQFGGTSTTPISTTVTNTRNVNIFGGQLYVSAASLTFQGVAAVGSGTPTTSGQTTTLLPGFPTASGPGPYSYFFADLDAGVTGLDTVYVADDRTSASGGIQKWCLVGGTWTLKNTIQTPCRGLTGSVSGSTVTLYLTTQPTLNSLATLTDTAGYDVANNGTVSTLATATTNKVFRGVALAPVSAATAPTITSFAPTSGAIGATVVITGTDFTGATTVAFNGTAAAFSVNSSTQITATVPAGATTGKVSVTTPAGTATSTGDFTVIPAPTITSFAPTTGPIGTSVVITGTEFTGATVVTFNGTTSTFAVDSATQITATVPSGALTGKIGVTTPGGTATSTADFTVTAAAPTVTSFTPLTGPVGTVVTITGTNLTGAASVAFNGTNAATLTVDSDTQITATVPTGATTGKVSVTTAGGTATSTADFTVTIPAPAITSFTPTSGAIGATVVITGTNFTGASAVALNGTAAAFTVNSATQITTTVPTGATTGTISVTTGGGTATSSGSFTVIPAPTISGFTPITGAPGTTVVITGTEFTGATSVTFNGTSATFVVDSATQITATVPAGATTGKIAVVTPGGTATSTADFTPPTITPTVLLNEIYTNPPVTADDTREYIEIRSTTGGVESLSNVWLLEIEGDSTTGRGTVDNAINLSSFSTGTNGLAVVGHNYQTTTPWTSMPAATTKINMGRPSSSTIENGGVTFLLVTNFTGAIGTDYDTNDDGAFDTTPWASIVDAVGWKDNASGFAYTSAELTIPSATIDVATRFPGNNTATSAAAWYAGKTDGLTSLTTSYGTPTTTNFPASGAGFTPGAPNVPIPAAAPTITSFTPTSGPVGTSVVITGTDLTGATVVSFNGTNATTFTVDSATQITATVPTGATTGKVSVTTSGGPATSSGDFTVTIVNTNPTISDITDKSTNLNTATSAILFTVGDAQTAVADLTVAGSSSNQTLVPDANIVFGGSGANRTVTITPANGQSGTATITVTVTDAGALTATDTFVLTVNGKPTISAITTQTGTEDIAIGPVSFTVGDDLTAAGSLTLSATSSDTTLVPNANIVFGGSGANRTVTVTPAANQSGTTSITITVTDGGGLTETSTFDAAFVSVLDDPTITNIADRSTPLNTATGAIVFTIGDAETAATLLTVSGTSNDQTLVPNANIVFGGTGANRTVTITPASGQTGTAIITVTVTDGDLQTATDTFVLTVTGPNVPPTISTIANLTIAQSTSTGALAFTIGDNETATASLALSKASDNTLLAPLANIVFGGTDANRTVTITPNTTQSGTATITVTVTDEAGGTASTSFTLTVIPRPIINNVNPYAGGVGTTVGISGTHLGVAGGVTSVKFNGITASFTVSGSLITATVPAGNVNGPITVTTAGGTATSASNFALVGTPTINTFSPADGGYGTLVSFAGNNLSGATEVRLNGTLCPGFTVVNNSLIRFNVPTGTLPGKISVLTPGGLAESANDFTVYPPPQILSISPLVGNIGATVSIAGNFLSSVQSVRFSNAITSNFIAVNNNLIRIAVPAGAVTGKITVTTKGGAVMSTDNFTVILKPNIAVFSPTSGAPGTLISFSGNNLSGVSVSFNGVPATTTQVSAFQVRAVVPVGATTGKVSATNSAGDTGISAADFLVLQPPVITSLSTTTGPVGTGVTIAGANFSNVTGVKFNNTAATFVINNAGQITTSVPTGATTGKITVTSPYGSGLSADFTVTAGTAAPVVLSFNPTSGAAGSTVVLNGTGFLGATSVQFSGANSTFINANFRVDNAQKITATVPPNTITGVVRVVNASGAGVSSSSFTIVRFPVIYSFSPTTGPSGLAVTLTGANFTGTSSVTFATPTGTASAGFSLLSSTSIRCNVPNSAITGRIRVSNAFGTGQTDTDFLVTPKITSFTPANGPVGTLVTINGTAFTGATAVQFNGVLAEFTVVNGTRITATVPVGATTGLITVNNAGGVGNSTTNFTVQ